MDKAFNAIEFSNTKIENLFKWKNRKLMNKNCRYITYYLRDELLKRKNYTTTLSYPHIARADTKIRMSGSVEAKRTENIPSILKSGLLGK